MLIEVPTTEGYAAELISAKILRSLITIYETEVITTSELSEITIFTGGSKMIRVLENAEQRESLKFLYIITHTEHDAHRIEQELLRYALDPELLRTALQTIDADFKSEHWIEHSHLDMLIMDIADMIAAATLILPKDVMMCRTWFRGKTSWIES